MVLLQLLSLLKSLSSCFLWLYYLHLSMNPLYQLFPSVIKFAEHYHRNRRNAMFYQSSLREFEASYNHNCKGSLLQVSVLICKLSLSKIHTWCQGIEYKNAIRNATETCTITFDRLTNEKAEDYWQTHAGLLPPGSWHPRHLSTCQRLNSSSLHPTPPRHPKEYMKHRTDAFNIHRTTKEVSTQFQIWYSEDII